MNILYMNDGGSTSGLKCFISSTFSSPAGVYSRLCESFFVSRLDFFKKLNLRLATVPPSAQGLAAAVLIVQNDEDDDSIAAGKGGSRSPLSVMRSACGKTETEGMIPACGNSGVVSAEKIHISC